MKEKIMIVDDEPSVRKTVNTILSIKGYKISEAINADDAWKKIQKDKPDLILLDIMMPGMQPKELIKKIKDNPKLKSIKIIYLTAVMGAKEALKGSKEVFATIEKPFTNTQIRDVIKKALK